MKNDPKKLYNLIKYHIYNLEMIDMSKFIYQLAASMYNSKTWTDHLSQLWTVKSFTRTPQKFNIVCKYLNTFGFHFPAVKIPSCGRGVQEVNFGNVSKCTLKSLSVSKKMTLIGTNLKRLSRLIICISNFLMISSLNRYNKMADYLINRPFCSDHFIRSYEILRS